MFLAFHIWEGLQDIMDVSTKFYHQCSHVSTKVYHQHFVKGVRIRGYSGPYFPHLARMRENTDQNNSEYGHISRSAMFL